MPTTTLQANTLQTTYPQNVFNSPSLRAKLSNNISTTPRNMTPPTMTPWNSRLSVRPISVLPKPVMSVGEEQPPNIEFFVSAKKNAPLLPPRVAGKSRQGRVLTQALVEQGVGPSTSGGVGRGAWQRSGVTVTPRAQSWVTQEATATKAISEIKSEVSSLRRELKTFLRTQTHSPAGSTLNGPKDSLWRVFPTESTDRVD